MNEVICKMVLHEKYIYIIYRYVMKMGKVIQTKLLTVGVEMGGVRNGFFF